MNRQCCKLEQLSAAASRFRVAGDEVWGASGND